MDVDPFCLHLLEHCGMHAGVFDFEVCQNIWYVVSPKNATHDNAQHAHNPFQN